MQIRVLAIGPRDIEKMIMNVEKEYPELSIHYATYHNEEEVIEIVKKYGAGFQIILFAGSLPYKIAKNNLKLDQSIFFIPFEGTALYRALFQLALNGKYDLQNGTLNISIDNLQKYEVEESLEELEIRVQNIYYDTHSEEFHIEKTTRFHYELWKNGQIDTAITCVGLIYERLIELGVPAVRVLPTRNAVRNTLQIVLMEAQKLKKQNSHIAIGIVDLKEIFEQDDLTEYQLQRRLLALQQSLVDYGEKTQAIIKWIDRRELRFITTREALQLDDQQHSNELTLIHDIFQKTERKVQLGIGIGRSTNEAEMYALEALKKAKASNTDYIIYDANGKIYGPVMQSGILSYSLWNDNEKVLEIAQKANVSSSTINRILSFFKIHGKNSVTAIELAKGLRITPRSARRLLSRLEQAGLVSVTGEEQPVNRGRPRQIYSLLLDQWSMH
ncbi:MULTISPECIES: transcriptional regulator [Geobacillus]|uniref:transcriptional regulator n=1 Tax=Geobacillus TaxID=129337 RepID=UPI000C290ECA|nr:MULTISPECIES: transcriptional regulator [Geobacillus]MEC5188739.1 DNA-binding transcriptional ArsR family regulator [Geobacillus thermodenitrificans]PJW16126.1 transcriptional regulator [Geobacillus sp. WSUCF-018B]WJQ08430.1 transcriptional regulator [Geobacillus stearothermophilus]